MAIYRRMQRAASKQTATDSPGMQDGKIINVDPNYADMYVVQYADGRTASKVPGPVGMLVGDSVSCGKFPGKSQRPVIIGPGYAIGADKIIEVEV